jgi:hypothetical protein
LQAHLARSGQDIVDLCRDLADALTLFEEGTEDKHNATADALTTRLTSKDTILSTLKANRWLLTILLGVLTTPELIEATKAVTRTGNEKKRPPVVPS